MEILKFKKLHPEAKAPTRAHSNDAGADLVATSMTITKDYIEYGTGIAIQLGDKEAGLLMPRSSISKYDLLLCNSIGLIDSGYLGELKFRFKPTKDAPNIYGVGDKIGQLVIIPVSLPFFIEITDLGKSDRSDGAFGSSGV